MKPALKLNREQQQRLLLGVILTLMAVAGIWQFAIKPVRLKTQAVHQQAESVRTTLDSNRRLVDAADARDRIYQQVRSDLQQVLEKELPPSANATAWASDFLMQIALDDNLSVELQSISEAGTERFVTGGRDAPPPLFEDYLLQAQVRGGYHDIGRFLAKLESRNSFVRVASMELKRDMRDESKLAVSLKLAFPRLTEEGFPPEERPDAEVPRITPPKGPDQK